MSSTPIVPELTQTDRVSIEKSPETPNTEHLCSPKSSDSKKSPDSANRRKKKPKKVSNTENNSDVELLSPQANFPAISAIALKETPKNDSDDCETIDKIAQMVSNFTSSSSPLAKSVSIPTLASPPQAPSDLCTPAVSEVENKLEQMFSETKPVNSTDNAVESIDGNREQESTKNGVDEGISEQQQKLKPKIQRKKKKMDGGNNRKQKKGGINGKGNGKADKFAKKGFRDSQQHDKGKKKSKENGSKAKVKVDVAPYLQIQNDGSFNIINETINGEDDGEKALTKTKKSVNVERHKGIRGLHVSTLSNKYDKEKRDVTWVCVFCKLGPHKCKLGDLFGPYIVRKSSKEYELCLEDPVNDIFRQGNRNKFAPIESKTPPKKKRKISDSSSGRKLTSPTTSGVQGEVNGPDACDEVFTAMTQLDEQTYEIWFHEDCIVWSPGTHIVGSKIIGLEQAVWQSTRHRCNFCQKNGAMIACLTRGCKSEAHIICARKNWKLCDDFKTYCEQHHSN